MKRMPRAQHSPHVAPRIIVSLLAELIKFQRDEAAVRREYPWAERFVMGLPLAPWQRGFCWSDEQSARFITSAWTGVHLGNYVLTEDHMLPGPCVEYAPLANCVVEGQQRLRALELYFTDQLAVRDAEGDPTRWSELDRQEQMWFERVIFNCGVVRESDELKLREFYDLMNFGGVAHGDDERALGASTL